MIVIVNKYLPGKGFAGISLWPFVFIKKKKYAGDPVFLNHERIHLRQQVEMLIIPFYLWYLTEFFIKLVYYQNSYRAYRTISFEREAYAREKDLTYCKTRKLWNFLPYLSRGKP